MKISNDIIGNRTRELPTCNAVPQPTAPPGAPRNRQTGNFHSRAMHFDIKVLLPTNAQENRFKMSIKIYIKTAPTCFDVITIIIKEGTI